MSCQFDFSHMRTGDLQIMLADILRIHEVPTDLPLLQALASEIADREEKDKS